MAITAFLSRSPGLLNRGPGGQASLRYIPHSSIFSPTTTAQSVAWGSPLLGAGFLYCTLSRTDWTSCAPSYIIVRRPPSSCGRHKSHSFNPSTVKVISWYSSTGCTCYLHRCIFYLTAWPGSICYMNVHNDRMSKRERGAGYSKLHSSRSCFDDCGIFWGCDYHSLNQTVIRC